MSNRSYLLIDFSNLVYASFFRAISDDGIDPQNIPLFYNRHVKLFNDRVQSIRQYHGLAEVVFALDQKPTYKYEIFPDYKKGRGGLKNENGTFFDAKQPCLDDLEHQGATVVYAADHEADDTIASFVAQNFNNEITVITTDKDIWAILDHPNVKILNFLKGEYITKQHLRESFCTKDKHKIITNHLKSYSQIKLWKAMWGDVSDGVPNVMLRMKKQLLPYVIQSDGTWEDFKAKVDPTKISAKCNTMLEENFDKIQLNFKLVELKYNLDLQVETYQKTKGSTADPLTPEIIETLF